MLHAKRGFTVLEGLLVLLVFGVAAALGAFFLNDQRAKNRDTQRISDISVLRAALSQYWLQKASYPLADPIFLGQPGIDADKLSGNGFVGLNVPAQPVYLLQVPVGPRAGEYYRYQGIASGYTLQFNLEKANVYGDPGIWYAHSDGSVDKDEIPR